VRMEYYFCLKGIEKAFLSRDRTEERHRGGNFGTSTKRGSFHSLIRRTLKIGAFPLELWQIFNGVESKNLGFGIKG